MLAPLLVLVLPAVLLLLLLVRLVVKTVPLPPVALLLLMLALTLGRVWGVAQLLPRLVVEWRATLLPTSTRGRWHWTSALLSGGLAS